MVMYEWFLSITSGWKTKALALLGAAVELYDFLAPTVDLEALFVDPTKKMVFRVGLMAFIWWARSKAVLDVRA